MPNPYREFLTWWEATGADGHGGYNFNAPMYLPCRWEDKVEQFRTPGGELDISRALVYVPVADDNFKVGDYLFRGQSQEDDPTTVQEAFSIRQKVKIPDLRYVRTEVRLLL